MSEREERWRPVVGHPGYEVSDLGRVRSVKYSKPRILATYPHKDDYLRVRLWNNNQERWRLLHTLVAEAFIGPRAPGIEVRHYDDDKNNNALSNLSYGSRSENMLDAVRNGRQAQSKRTHCPQGHPYDAANTYYRPSGWRCCRRCQSERQIAERRNRRVA